MTENSTQSLKQALNAVKNAFDSDEEGGFVRAYIHSIGFSARLFKQVVWQDLLPYTDARICSVFLVLRALKLYADDKDIIGIKERANTLKRMRTKRAK